MGLDGERLNISFVDWLSGVLLPGFLGIITTYKSYNPYTEHIINQLYIVLVEMGKKHRGIWNGIRYWSLRSLELLKRAAPYLVRRFGEFRMEMESPC